MRKCNLLLDLFLKKLLFLFGLAVYLLFSLTAVTQHHKMEKAVFEYLNF